MVGAFGVTTANCAASGLIDWPVAALFLAGDGAGDFAGMRAAIRLAHRKGLLTRVFADIIVAVALYVMARSLMSLGLL